MSAGRRPGAQLAPDPEGSHSVSPGSEDPGNGALTPEGSHSVSPGSKTR